MEIIVAILIIAVIAAVAYAVVQRRNAGHAPGLGRRHDSPLPPRSRGAARHDPMADAVHEHAQATHPADVVAAEQRLQAQARNVSAGMQAGAPATGYQQAAPAGYEPAANGAYAGGYDPQAYPAGQPPAAGQAAPTGPAVPYGSDPSLDDHFDPVTGERIDGHGDPANDPRLNDPRYDGRLAADWVDPNQDERLR